MNAIDSYTVILPAKNEGQGLRRTLPILTASVPLDKILVVDDGSDDDTVAVCMEAGVQVVSHPYSMGNGAAIKTGARTATGDVLVFMDADGQHDPEDIHRLLARLNSGYDMVVGSRTGSEDQASAARHFANSFYNRFSSWMVGHRIEDLTSGFRAVRADRFREFLYLLPNGFSYPTTITMAFFRAGYPIAYEPIRVAKRLGKSHIQLVRDGLRFLLIIFKVGTLYSPLKLFIPVSAGIFFTGILYYAYTYSTIGRFTNMSGLMFTTSVVIFMMGLVSEQITALQYRRDD